LKFIVVKVLDRREIILDIVGKNPGIRFNEIMRVSKIRNGTLSHYVKKLEDKGSIILHRTPRVTRLYPAGISKNEAKICKCMTIDTQKKIILFLIKKKVATSIEIRDFIKKSPSVISVNLSELFKEKIIDKEYDIPSNKFSLRNSEEVTGIINEYYPKLCDRLSNNTIKMLDF
jgi:predicted transcriptional regulator